MLRQKLLQFLMGLNDNYSHARSQILMMSVPSTVNQCYAMIIQDESQRELCGDHYTLAGQLDSIASFFPVDLEAMVLEVMVLGVKVIEVKEI